MNQVAVFAGLLFWSWVGGIWGMLLAVPMMMAIKVICDHVEPLRRSHTYLASDTFQYSPPRSGFSMRVEIDGQQATVGRHLFISKTGRHLLRRSEAARDQWHE